MINEKLEELITKHFEKEEKEIHSEFIKLIVDLINNKLVVLERTIPKSSYSDNVLTVTSGLRLKFIGMEELTELRLMKEDFESLKEENEMLKDMLNACRTVVFYE